MLYEPAVPGWYSSADLRDQGWPSVGRNWGCHQSEALAPPFGFRGPECPSEGGGGGGSNIYGFPLCGDSSCDSEIVPSSPGPVSLWMPDLEAVDGELRTVLDVPDDQRRRRLWIIVVDDAGGVGSWLGPLDAAGDE